MIIHRMEHISPETYSYLVCCGMCRILQPTFAETENSFMCSQESSIKILPLGVHRASEHSAARHTPGGHTASEHSTARHTDGSGRLPNAQNTKICRGFLKTGLHACGRRQYAGIFLGSL